MVAVDTNILVRAIIQDHPDMSPKALKILDQAKPRTLLLDRLIIEELGYVLRVSYGFNKAHISKTYKALLSEDKFSIPDRIVVERTVDLFESEKPLSFEDCWLLALQRSNEVSSVATFDADLAKRL